MRKILKFFGEKCYKCGQWQWFNKGYNKLHNNEFKRECLECLLMEFDESNNKKP